MKRITRDVSKWNIVQHRHARGLPLVDKDDRPERQLEDELFDRLYAGESEPLPETEQGPLSKWATRLHETASALPSFQRLALDCHDDPDAAATAVEVMMTELRPHMQAEESNRPLPESAIRKGLTRVVVKAGEKIAEQREAAEALEMVAVNLPGSGTGRGERMNEASPRKLAERLRTDARLRRIALLAGRFTRIAARKQRTKVKHGSDEITDVETGSDLARLLPVELGAILHPLRKLALFRNLIENRALQYHMDGVDSLGKGPVVVLLDKSGSMQGSSDEWATAVALALMWIAQKQKRRFALIGFDGGIKSEHVVEPGDRLPEDALFTSCAGGTSIENAVRRGLDVVEATECRLRKADVVLITDGGSGTDRAPELRERARLLGVTALGFGIGVSREALAPWCDEAQAVEDLDNVDGRNAEALFTI